MPFCLTCVVCINFSVKKSLQEKLERPKGQGGMVEAVYIMEITQPLGTGRAEFKSQFCFLAEGPWANTLSIKWN